MDLGGVSLSDTHGDCVLSLLKTSLIILVMTEFLIFWVFFIWLSQVPFVARILLLLEYQHLQARSNL